MSRYRHLSRALTVGVGTAVGLWLVDRLTKSITDSVAKVLGEATSAVGQVTDSLSRLVLPYETTEQVPQQDTEEWTQGDILTPAEQFEASLDGEDWTDQFTAMKDAAEGRVTPEIALVPLDEQQMARFAPGSPMMGPPDLSAEDL